MSQFNVVDSSGWLEYFFATDRMPLFKDAIDSADHLVVPVICIYEVYKKLRRDRGEADASRAALAMQTGRVVTLDFALAIAATTLSLAMADSLIYATAARFDATLWTQDEHFKDLPGVRYFPK